MKVSIITVVFNGEKYIRSCIESVLAQDYPEIEYIVIDGNSSDNTCEIVKSFGQKIHRLVSEPDKGIYDAMNKGIRLASGDLIGILNADDFYASGKIISEVVGGFSGSDSDLLFGDLIYVKPDNENRIVRYYRGKSFTKSRLKFGDMPPHPTMFVKRKIYESKGLYKTDYRICADFDMISRLIAVEGLKWKYMPLTMVVMRTGGVSTSGIRSRLAVNREILRACRENGIRTNSLLIWMKYFRKIFQLTGRPAELPGFKPG